MSPSVWTTAWLVARKELVSYFRDRQTVLYTVVLPLVMYPLLFWILIQGLTVLRGRDAGTRVVVEVVDARDASDAQGVPLVRLLDALGAVPAEAAHRGELLCLTVDALPTDEARAEHLRGTDDVDARLVLGVHGARLWYDSTRSGSELAALRVEERLALLAEELREEAASGAGTALASLAPFRLEAVNLAGADARSAFQFSFVLPLVFVVMAVMGALYPAIEATAGEKERGTAETTLLLPSARLGVQLGKLAAVTVSALGATLLNLAGMVLAAEPLMTSLEPASRVEIPWRPLFLAVPLCAGFLVTVSAMMLALGSFTDTFKQGQAVLGPVQLVFIVPAVFAILPTVSLTPGLALVPVLQTVLAFKTVLSEVGSRSGPPHLELVLVFVSQTLYAVIAVGISLRLATRETLALGSASTRAFLTHWRRDATPR